jgi:hypothetical protein
VMVFRPAGRVVVDNIIDVHIYRLPQIGCVSSRDIFIVFSS